MPDAEMGDRSNERSEGISVEGSYGSLAPADRDKNLAISAGNILQALFCISHLIRSHADDANKLHQYSDLAEEKLKELSELMRPMLFGVVKSKDQRLIEASCEDNHACG